MPFVQENRFHPYGAPVERGGLPAPTQNYNGRLPVWKTVGRSLGAVFVFLPSLLKAAVFPIALHLALLAPPLLILSDRLLPGGGALRAQGADRPMLLATLAIFLLVSFVASSLFVATWTRALALGPDRGRVPLLPEWGRRGWRSMRMRIFTLIALVLAGVFAVAAARGVAQFYPEPLALVPVGVGIPLVVLALFLIVRFSVGTVAAAMDDPWSVDEALRATRRHNLRLLFGVGLTLVFGLVIALILFGALTLIAGFALKPEGFEPEMTPSQIAALDWGWRIQAAAIASLLILLLDWYLLRACAFAFLTQAWLFFRESEAAPHAAGGRFTSHTSQRVEPAFRGLGHGTRSGGAWPGDLARYSDGTAKEREEDWVDPPVTARGGLPPEEDYATSHSAQAPYEDLWEGDVPQAEPEEPDHPGDGAETADPLRGGPDIFRSLRRDPDDRGDR